MIKTIAIFASGSGTNADNIIKKFRDYEDLKINAVFVNNPNAGVIEKARKKNVEVILFDKELFKNPEGVLKLLKEKNTDYIVLAGFLWLLPTFIISEFKDRIINIHPSLLPKHGGKGMYGIKVHKNVLDSGETTSGITIHLVNEHYDEGKILFQTECPVMPDDTPESLAQRIHQLEYRYFPPVIKEYINGENNLIG